VKSAQAPKDDELEIMLLPALPRNIIRTRDCPHHESEIIVQPDLSLSPDSQNTFLHTFQVPFSGRQGLRRVFSNPNCATAFDTEGSEPYGLLRLLKRKGYLTPFLPPLTPFLPPMKLVP
jgi:hypothetical protein